MLWPCGGVGGDGYPGDSCLRDALEALRPWTDELAVETALQTWADRHYPRPMKGDVTDVAADLKIIGTATELPDAESAAGMTAFMMVNVFHGRKTRDYDTLREVVKGIPASTARRYRQRFGAAAFSEYMRQFQYGQDLVALMHAGRKLPAARRYLERRPRTPSMGHTRLPPPAALAQIRRLAPMWSRSREPGSAGRRKQHHDAKPPATPMLLDLAHRGNQMGRPLSQSRIGQILRS